MSASFAVQTALITALRGHTEVQAALGSPARVYDMPPAEVTFPFAILERAEARPWGGGPDEGHEHSLSLHVWSRYGGARECKTILAAMQTVMGSLTALTRVFAFGDATYTAASASHCARALHAP